MSKKTPKPKKKHKGLIIFLIIFSILVVFPAGFIFGAFYTTDTKPVSNSEVTYQNIVSRAFYNGIKDLSEEEPKLKFTVDEEMFDGILMGACEKIGQPQYIPKMYCYIKDNNYTFVVDLQASFFKSRVQIYTSLSKEGDTLTFKINGITLGRLPIPLNWITSILGNFINDEMLNNAFDKAGFHLKSHLSETKLTYDRTTFKDDAKAYIEKLGADNPYLKLLLPILGDEEHEIFSTEYKDGITAAFNLTKLQLSEGEYHKEAPLHFTELDKHQEKIIEWLNKGYLLEENVDEMFTYLIRGINVSEDVSNFINQIDLGSYKGRTPEQFKNEITTYIGTDLTAYSAGSKIEGTYSTFSEYCGNGSIRADFTLSGTTSATFTVNTDSLNRYLAHNMTDAIGKTIPITFKDENENWGFEYILVDNLYVGFDDTESSENPKMIMYLTLNISGVQLGLALETSGIKISDPGSGSFGKLDFNLKHIYFGEIEIDDFTLLNPIFQMIPLTGTFTYANRTFSVNLDNVLGNLPNKDAIIAFITAQGAKPTSSLESGDLKIIYTKQP